LRENKKNQKKGIIEKGEKKQKIEKQKNKKKLAKQNFKSLRNPHFEFMIRKISFLFQFCTSFHVFKFYFYFSVNLPYRLMSIIKKEKG